MSESQNNLVIEQQDKFTRNIIHEAALASNNISSDNFDLDKSKSLCSDGIATLGAQSGLEC